MDEHEIEGYAFCPGCQRLDLKAVLRRQHGLCLDCAVTETAVKTKVVEVMHRGKVTGLRNAAKSKKSKGSSETKQKGERAKQRAMRRLKHIFPEVYSVLLAEERAAVGMEPWPLERLERPDPEAAVATLAFADVYHLLDGDQVSDEEGPSTAARRERRP